MKTLSLPLYLLMLIQALYMLTTIALSYLAGVVMASPHQHRAVHYGMFLFDLLMNVSSNIELNDLLHHKQSTYFDTDCMDDTNFITYRHQHIR